MSIPFETVHEELSFHSPLEGMKLVHQRIERRRDPLLGHWAVASSGLAGKGAFFFHARDMELMERLASESRASCLFCPEKVEAVTPRYPEELLPGGCLREGECFLFPNLFPIAPLHAVVAWGAQHFRQLDDFPPALVRDGISAALRFVRSVHGAQPQSRFFTVNTNYLSPAGASMIHPHLQLLGGRDPCTAVQCLRQACQRHRAQHGGDYFEQLVEEEARLGQRYVAGEGGVHWLTPFAPSGSNEVLAVLPGQHDLCAIDEQAVVALAHGVSRVLAHYWRCGFSTFNMTLFADACGSEEAAFPVHLRLICRQNVSPDYRTDDYFMQKLLGEELMLTTPEELAEGLRQGWEG